MKETYFKYHNNQCFTVPPFVIGQNTKRKKISYTCLNRMDISEERIRGSETYDDKRISNRLNLFEIFNENDTRNVVTDTKIVCGNDSINNYDYQSIIHCKKDKNDLEEIPILLVDVHNAFDFMHAKSLQLSPSETEHVIYQQGK